MKIVTNSKEYMNEYYQKHKEKFKEYNKKYIKKNIKKIREYMRNYQSKYNKKNRENAREKDKQYREKYPIRKKAYNRMRRLRKKIIGNECKICGNKENLQFHHTNYEKDEGFTVCAICHSKIHRGEENF